MREILTMVINMRHASTTENVLKPGTVDGLADKIMDEYLAENDGYQSVEQ